MKNILVNEIKALKATLCNLLRCIMKLNCEVVQTKRKVVFGDVDHYDTYLDLKGGADQMVLKNWMDALDVCA